METSGKYILYVVNVVSVYFLEDCITHGRFRLTLVTYVAVSTPPVLEDNNSNRNSNKCGNKYVTKTCYHRSLKHCYVPHFAPPLRLTCCAGRGLMLPRDALPSTVLCTLLCPLFLPIGLAPSAGARYVVQPRSTTAVLNTPPRKKDLQLHRQLSYVASIPKVVTL